MNKRIEPAQEQLVSILRTAKNGLQYLTQNDWVLAVDRAKLVVAKKGSTLIQQGKQTRMVYLLVKGRVTIETSSVNIAQIGPGQICGEMAFLEDTLASATATVDEDVEAYALSWRCIKRSLRTISAPGLAFLSFAGRQFITQAPGADYV